MPGEQPKSPRRRPSHATVVAYLALFVALGGVGAYAASKIGSKDIKRAAVKAKHIKPDAVRAQHMQDGAVGSAEIADASVTGPKVADASVAAAKLDLSESASRAGRASVTGSGGQPLGVSLTLNIPAGGVVLFEARANISRSAGIGGCRIFARSGSFDEPLLEPEINSGNSPEPFESGIVPSHPPSTGVQTFELVGTVNGLTTETCHFDDVAFDAIVVR
jgi:hypothetical protein